MGIMIICVTVVIGSCLVLEGCCFNEFTKSISQPFAEMHDSSVNNFWNSVISLPCGETNAVYYAGSIDDKAILMHETSAGVCKWEIRDANIEMCVIMPFTVDKGKWLLLKGTTDQQFRHWDWKKEIEDTIQSLTRNSALVKPLSTFYRIDGDLNASNVCVVRVDEFLVVATLCDILKKDDKICTQQLYDGSIEDKNRIISETRLAGNPVVGRNKRDGRLCFAHWEKGRFLHSEELPDATFFAIDNEIVAPFEFVWDGRYDGLLEFDEQFAVDSYIRRVESERRNRHVQEQNSIRREGAKER